MNTAEHRVRRATVDDLQELEALWKSMRLPVEELERRLTDFQVIEAPDGKLIGALGFQITNRHGRVHSEAFADFTLADQFRQLLWRRIQSLAMNHGVFRVWTQEKAPFWTRNGFQLASPEALQKIPSVWDTPGTSWMTLQLKDEEAIASMEKELAMFMESEKQRTARTLDQARLIKNLVTVIACGLAVVLIGAAIYFFISRRAPPGTLPQ
jgi:N-acetylglutamate synthase-like GNAT family acetyltransferase